MADQAGTFRRVGEVTARKLSKPLRWVTESGDELTGETGDWVVDSPTAGVRTVKDPEFHTLYEYIAGDRWRRLGTVTARHVAEPVVVETLEGPVTARVGDWIVTAPDGSSWPVPGEVFRSSYERA